MDLPPQPADLGEAAVRLGDLEVTRRCYEAMLPYAGRGIVVSGLVAFGGAVDHHLGFLALALGDRGGAPRHLHTALAIHARLGTPAWAEASWALLPQAETTTTTAIAGALIREAKTWRISWNRIEAHVPDSKGIRDLAVLLERCGQEIHAAELYAAWTDGTVAAGASRGDEAVDRDAVGAYRQRLDDVERGSQSPKPTTTRGGPSGPPSTARPSSTSCAATST